MNIIADTNLLVRFLTQDDENQFKKVVDIFIKSRKIIIPINVLCELVWVLSYSYKFKNDFIADRIQKLANNPKIVIQQSAVNFGIKMLEKNGDFSDGINAFSGMEMAFGEPISFVSFDKKAIKILKELGIQTIAL